MLELAQLSPADVGRWVTYHGFLKTEKGRIKSWNDKFVYVVYYCDGNWDRFSRYTAAPTLPHELSFADHEQKLPG